MIQIEFTKMVASGNDFVVIEEGHQLSPNQVRGSLRSQVRSRQSLAKKICDRKYGVGADGLLVLDKSKLADIKMRIFNPDGSEAQMCGNGARCISLWLKSKIPACPAGRKNKKSKNFKIETRAGIIESKVNGDNVKIKLTNPKDLKIDIPIRVRNRILHASFINTGVPHAVIFVEGLDKIDVRNLGREIRYHKRFLPGGTNVDFVEVLDNNSIIIRTYERGVEDETLACGTGSVASALTFVLKTKTHHLVKVHTKSSEILKVYFAKISKNFSDVWLEGQAKIVFKGNFLN